MEGTRGDRSDRTNTKDRQESFDGNRSTGMNGVATIVELDGGDNGLNPLPPRKAILLGYHRGKLPKPRALIAFGALFMVALILGMAVAWLPAARLSLLVIPVVALSVMIIWVLPEGAKPPVRLMEAMFFAYFVALTLWPYYLALDIPGFPLIEIRRVFIALAIVAMMISLSISPDFRVRLRSLIAGSPLIFALYAGFVATQLISLPLARDPGISISAFVRDQMGWTAVLLIASYTFSRKGGIARWSGVLRAMAIFMSFLAFAEFKNKSVLWANHIPSFLTMNDPVIIRLLTPSFRGNAYRVIGPFPVSLSLAEWLALTMPFFLYYMIFGKNLIARAICLVADVLVFVAILSTQARIGLVGMLIAHAVFVGAWALRARRLNRGSSLLPTAVLAAYPVILVTLVAAVLTIPALTVRVLGGGAQAASTDARGEQFNLAWPMILGRPFNGHGVGNAALTVNWTSPGGQVSLDSYIITLLVDYGFIGFALYVALIGTAIVQGFQLSSTSEDDEIGYSSAAAVGLCIWATCQFVLSQEDNASLIFMLIAVIVAARWRVANAMGGGNLDTVAREGKAGT